jgi:hypothetical protein
MSEYGSYFDTNKIKENIQHKHFHSIVDSYKSYDYNEEKKDELEELIRVNIIFINIESRLNQIINLENIILILKQKMD